MISVRAKSPGRERSDRRERSASPGDAPRASRTQLKIFGDLEPNGSTEGLVIIFRTTNSWDRPRNLWQKKGQKIWCRLPGRGPGVSILGAMDAHTGTMYHQVVQRPQKPEIIKFLRWVGRNMDHEESVSGEEF